MQNLFFSSPSKFKINFKVLSLLLITAFCSAFAPTPTAERTAYYRAEADYPRGVFRSPLGIGLVLSGTFGELRNNHFHAGLDCKTQGVEGKNIYSIQDGYVTRIKVSPRGYGTALYVKHYNGFTSVYAHLRSFNYAIGQYVKDRQYALQSFELDEAVPTGLLTVKKGEIVAKSGNSGSSSAPHLHFEVRDSATEEAINPLLFGFKVGDTRRPSVQAMGIYDLTSETLYGAPKLYATKYEKGKYKLPRNLFKVGAAKVGLGIKAYDKQNGANNLNGIYSLELFDNGQKVYRFDVERIGFPESRFINAHLDYNLKTSGKGNLQKCFVDPNNQLKAYKKLTNRGIIDLSDGQPHKMRFVIQDIAGNTTNMDFTLQYDPSRSKGITVPTHEARFSYAVDNYFDRDGIRLRFPYGSFYNDVYFKYKATAPPAKKRDIYSAYHQVHNGKTPVHQFFDVRLRASRVPDHLKNKAFIAYKNVKGRTRVLKSTWEDHYLRASSKEFGTYFVTTDSTPPKITPINIKNGGNLSKNKTITFKISDGLSGIKNYNAYVDGQWILMEYDSKSARLRHWFDWKIPKGKHNLELIVEDMVGNIKTYNASFTR